MSTTSTALLGIAFCVLGFSTTFLMFHLWGYPFDKVARKSSAPKSLMMLHRALGFCFVAVYIVMMAQMVPRLWEYQVEFPPRTVAHILLGFTVGFILLIKISIIRFFRHLEEWMPYLGVGLLLCTFLLLGLSLPFVYKESRLADLALSPERIARVERLLSVAEFPDEAPLPQLSTKSELLKGREVLLRQCVRCHDLKTIISKPRTPQAWASTVKRMGEKPALFDPISQEDEWRVTSYLIAITPDLQAAQKALRQAELHRVQSQAAMEGLVEKSFPMPDAGGAGTEEPAQQTREETPNLKPETKPERSSPRKATKSDAATSKRTPMVERDAVDAVAPDQEDKPPRGRTPAQAQSVFQEQCSLCHELADVDGAPPKSKKGVSSMISRMVDNGMDVSADDLALIRWYLIHHYVNGRP